ncbi:MAG: hypothetical protein ACLRFI_00365 [Alphaproteobacteria bacterium]
MKKCSIIALCLTLCACGGGSKNISQQTPATPHEKTPYELWLEAGNTGTYQDYLDSLVAPTPETWDGNGKGWRMDNLSYSGTIGEYLTNEGKSVTKTDAEWEGHNGYTIYTYHDFPLDNKPNGYNKTRYDYVYNDKQLDLGNYGVWFIEAHDYQHGQWVSGYVHNRDIGETYIPDTNTTFTGGTLAYLKEHNANAPTLIKGDATFVYDPTDPSLELAFDNYYNINVTRTNTTIQGQNSTGKEAYDLPTGTFEEKHNQFFEVGYVRDENTEEAFGTYEFRFDTMCAAVGGCKIDPVNSDFTMTGAFGGTKQ